MMPTFSYLEHYPLLIGVSVLAGLLSVEHDAEESFVTDDEERPLSQGELRKRIMRGVRYKAPIFDFFGLEYVMICC